MLRHREINGISLQKYVQICQSNNSPYYILLSFLGGFERIVL